MSLQTELQTSVKRQLQLNKDMHSVQTRLLSAREVFPGRAWDAFGNLVWRL